MVKVEMENGHYLFKLDDLLNKDNISKNKLMRDTNTDTLVFARLCDYFDCELTDIIEYVPNDEDN